MLGIVSGRSKPRLAISHARKQAFSIACQQNKKPPFCKLSFLLSSFIAGWVALGTIGHCFLWLLETQRADSEKRATMMGKNVKGKRKGHALFPYRNLGFIIPNWTVEPLSLVSCLQQWTTADASEKEESIMIWVNYGNHPDSHSDQFSC